MADGKCICTVRGSINHDEYFHVQHIVRPGETLSSRGHESRVGGKGANQAVAIARAGGSVRFYGSIGQDGTWIKDRMESYGIDVGGILIADEPTGRAIIQVDEEGENSIILFPGANYSELHEKTFTQQGDGWFPNTTHLLLQNEIPLRSTYYALQNAKNATVIMNPSPLPSAAEIRDFPWGKVDWLIVNEAEARELYQATAGSRAKAPGSLSTRELVFLLSAEPSFSTTNIVCTLGGDGVLVFVPRFHRPKTEHEAPSFLYLPAAKLLGDVRDTTGAGDCFTGYFVQGLMELGANAEVGNHINEHDIAQILKTCVHAAGMCVEQKGTIDSIPTRAQVEERMSLRS
ncbi:hypothetical protein GALMADRAFT_136953 [Galerina marginata CBS 339.88]|uniref:Ribokinase n=1 Tax=Galerina marginata (strain CBS 339.88) TaxID=685588 RepID=A0A067TNG4_GALM3|nr:hypothetical protein GALMADRAFT_136953 [Galerina marginata CBS 339.88]